MFKADHTCLLVSDLEAEQRFYERALCFKKVSESRPSEKVHMIFMTDECGGYTLQMVSGRGAPRPEYGHTAVVCNNFDEAFALHTAMGCVKGTMYVQQNQKSYFIVDPEGYEIEVIGKYAPESGI